MCVCVDIAELNLPKTCKTDFANPDDLLNFKLIIMPDEVNELYCVIVSFYIVVCVYT